MNTLTQLPPLSLYIHLPWCIQKCPYCDFNSHSIRQNELNETAYIQALINDLQTELPNIWGRSINSIFIGGGTPSLFQAASIDKLMSHIRALVKLSPQAEITLEANPGTFEREKFQGFKDAGINRLSIGVQSFQDKQLQAIGRVHNSQEAKRAIEYAMNIFERVNIDLMYALPEQTIQAATQDIQTAVSLGVPHISAYQLTLEPNTAFGHTPPNHLPSDELSQDIEEAVHQALFQAAYQRYEISAFTKTAHQQSQHNLNYWQFGDYIGIGAGAHGKISYATHIERTTRTRSPKDYLTAMHNNPTQAITRQKIATKDLPAEFMMNALRLTDGVPSQSFTERTGISLAQIAKPLTLATQKKLLDKDPRFLRPTALGQRFLNDLIELFL